MKRGMFKFALLLAGVALTINILQIVLIEDTDFTSASKLLYKNILDIKLHGDEVEDVVYIADESDKSVDKTENGSNDEIKLKYPPKNIGIVILTKKNELHHQIVEFNSQGIKLKYGKDLKKEKIYSSNLTIKSTSKVFKKNNVIKVSAYVKNKNNKDSKKNGQLISNVLDISNSGDYYIYRDKKGLVVVNRLDFEEYICGVVASEMPEKFEEEALKAQAVCARTYASALFKNKKNKYEKYDAVADNTTNYQVYGNKKISKKIRNCVKKTKGQILTYKDALINAYYFSTSCGFTTDYQIWGEKKQDYLKSIYVSKDKMNVDASSGDYFRTFIKNKGNNFEKNCAFYRWNITLNGDVIRNNIRNYFAIDIGSVKEIKITQRKSGGLVGELLIKGKKGKYKIKTQLDIRRVLSPLGYDLHLNDKTVRRDMTILPSAFFVVDKIENERFKITGGGFGHGSGMSQYGANEMAKKGYKYNEILALFYNDSKCSMTYK